MPQDFIPDSFQNRYDWLKNIDDRIDDYAADLNLDSGEVSAVKVILAPLIAKYGVVLDRQRDLDAAVGGANDAFDDDEAELRRIFGEWRKKSGFNDGIGRALGIVGIGGTRDPAAIKPKINKLEAFSGHVRVTGRKNYAESVDIQMRRVGTAPWTTVVSKRRTFPFDDQTPLAQPGVPEQREYRLVPFIGDTAVGQPSDAVSVLYGG